MADKDQYNDEYQFADLDVISPDSMDKNPDVLDSTISERRQAVAGDNNLRRNLIIAIVLIVLIYLAYYYLGPLFTRSTSKITPTTPAVQPAVPVPVQVQQTPQPTVQTETTPSPQVTELSQKVSALELGQQNLRTEMSSMTSQLNSISSNLSDLDAKIANINQTIANLSSKIEEQSHIIAVLSAPRVKPKPVRRVVRRVVPAVVYYIRAVIPGRAWLIASNGSTLTVREGTKIAGYGIVKLIDPNQGRVLTSSGRIITFSQQDS